jgi:hypothetical protein
VIQSHEDSYLHLGPRWILNLILTAVLRIGLLALTRELPFRKHFFRHSGEGLRGDTAVRAFHPKQPHVAARCRFDQRERER